MAARKRKTRVVRVARKKASPGALYEATSARVVIEVDLVKLFNAMSTWYKKLKPAHREQFDAALKPLLDAIPPGEYAGMYYGGRTPRSTQRVPRRAAKKGTR